VVEPWGGGRCGENRCQLSHREEQDHPCRSCSRQPSAAVCLDVVVSYLTTHHHRISLLGTFLHLQPLTTINRLELLPISAPSPANLESGNFSQSWPSPHPAKFLADDVSVNVNVIDFAIAPLKKVPQRCCDVQHDTHSREQVSLQSSFEAVRCVGASGSCSSRQLLPKLWAGHQMLAGYIYLLQWIAIPPGRGNKNTKEGKRWNQLFKHI